MVHPEKIASARALKPIHERQSLGRSICCSITWSAGNSPGLAKTHPGIADCSLP